MLLDIAGINLYLLCLMWLVNRKIIQNNTINENIEFIWSRWVSNYAPLYIITLIYLLIVKRCIFCNKNTYFASHKIIEDINLTSIEELTLLSLLLLTFMLICNLIFRFKSTSPLAPIQTQPRFDSYSNNSQHPVDGLIKLIPKQ